MAETIDQQFIEYIVKTIVGKPEQVRVERKIDERGVLLELYVDGDDLGRVIGRNGATAKSIRTLLRALGVKNDARYNLKIVDTNGGGRREASAGDHLPADTVATTPASDVSSSDATGTDQAAVSDETSVDDQPITEAVELSAEAPTAAEPTSTEEPSELDRHRREIDDITKGLDI